MLRLVATTKLSPTAPRPVILPVISLNSLYPAPVISDGVKSSIFSSDDQISFLGLIEPPSLRCARIKWSLFSKQYLAFGGEPPRAIKLAAVYPFKTCISSEKFVAISQLPYSAIRHVAVVPV